jgi:hypothetical protein
MRLPLPGWVGCSKALISLVHRLGGKDSWLSVTGLTDRPRATIGLLRSRYKA